MWTVGAQWNFDFDDMFKAFVLSIQSTCKLPKVKLKVKVEVTYLPLLVLLSILFFN